MPDEIAGPRPRKTQPSIGVLVDRRVAQLAIEMPVHDVAEPEDGALVGFFGSGQGTAKRSIDLGSGLVGNVGNGEHEEFLDLGHWEVQARYVKKTNIATRKTS